MKLIISENQSKDVKERDVFIAKKEIMNNKEMVILSRIDPSYVVENSRCPMCSGILDRQESGLNSVCRMCSSVVRLLIIRKGPGDV